MAVQTMLFPSEIVTSDIHLHVTKIKVKVKEGHTPEGV